MVILIIIAAYIAVICGIFCLFSTLKLLRENKRIIQALEAKNGG